MVNIFNVEYFQNRKEESYKDDNGNVSANIMTSIHKRPQNIIDLRMQTIYGITLIADNLLFDQVRMFI